MAIEKENSDILQPRENKINCSYYDKKNKDCRMWNSGVQKCAMYKCRFIKKIDRRKANCADCAYLYENICCHPKRLSKDTVSKNEAEYCFYYIGEEDNNEKSSNTVVGTENIIKMMAAYWSKTK